MSINQFYLPQNYRQSGKIILNRSAFQYLFVYSTVYRNYN